MRKKRVQDPRARSPIAANAWKFNKRMIFANPKMVYKRVNTSQIRKEHEI